MSHYPINLFRTSCGATDPLELNVSGPGWAGGQRRIFDQPFVLVGRDERSGLHLEDAAVSRRHAYLQQLGGRVFCVDLDSRTGIRWGGESRPAGWLRPEQEIQIGPFTLGLPPAARNGGGLADEVAENWDPLQDRMNDPRLLPRISVAVGNEVLSQMSMNRVMVLVGSLPACKVRLPDARVSRFHCSLVRTAEGVWLIDLLNRTGTCLNDEPVRWALVKEGDQLRVGPYVLRIWYPAVRKRTSPTRLPEIRAETPVPSADGKSESVPSGSVPAQALAVPREEPSATAMSTLVSALQAELDEAGERQREAETLRQQLADSQAECVRLREQARVLEIQLAEAADLQARLEAAEASEREMEAVCSERDHWRSEAQSLRTRIASDSAEREEWQQRLEAAQQQHLEEREAVRAAGLRLDQESATLQQLRADFTARNAEYDVALQRLQALQDELARSQEEARRLQAELDQALEHQRDVEALRQQLVDVQAEHAQLCARVPELEDQANSVDLLKARLQDAGAESEQLRVQLQAAESREAELESVRTECDRLRAQASVLEVQVAEMANLQVQLEAAQASARQLDVVRDERDRWQAEAQDLQARLASDSAEREQLGRLRADLDAAQWERERLQTEQQSSQRSAEQAWAKVSELERALTEATAAHATALAEAQARWESERHALETRLELEGQTHEGAIQAAVRAVEVRAAAEREEWRQQLEAAQQQLVGEREAVRAAVARLDQESATLQGVRGDLAARNAEHDAVLQRLQALQDELARSQEEARSHQAELDQARERLRDAETLRQQLAGSQAECDRLREQARMIEAQLAEAADLQARLEAAEASARELEAVCAERDRWQNEAQNLQTSIASDSTEQEQLDRLAADLHAAQVERDRLHTEQQASQQFVEQACARVTELERELADAAAAQDRAVAEARAGWESERQALEARLEQECQANNGATQAAIHNTPGHVGMQVSEVVAGPEAGGEKTVEQRSAPATPPAAQADTGKASIPSDAPQDAPAALEARQPGEDLRAWLRQQTDEERERLWRKFLNFVLRK